MLLFLLYRSEPPAQQGAEHVVRVREMSANVIFYNVRGQLAGLRTFRKLYECNGYPKVSDFGIFAFYAPVRKKEASGCKPFASFLTLSKRTTCAAGGRARSAGSRDERECNGFRWFFCFSLPFRLPTPSKGNFFWLLPRFWLPF